MSEADRDGAAGVDALLLSYDEALATGRVAADVVLDAAGLSGRPLADFHRGQRCVRLLERVWPRRGSAGPTQDWNPQTATPTNELPPCDVDSAEFQPIATVEQMKRAVADGGLITREDLDLCLSDLTGEQRPRRVDQLARQLVRRNILNEHQAGALCRGDLQKLTLGNYFIVEELGRGGMGIVYRAVDRKRHLQVALKMLRRTGGTSISRLKHEFRTLAGIAHPNLVTQDELRYADQRWFFTMEFIEGKHFTDHVRGTPKRDMRGAPLRQNGAPETHVEGDGALDAALRHPAQFVRLRCALGQLFQGLSVLHVLGKLHRDVKPSNVLVTDEGRVVLVDFGLVTEATPGPENHAAEKYVAGTLAYMSPEQLSQEPMTEASDWYSMGVLLFETLVGRQPFGGDYWEMLRQKQSGPPRLPAGSVPAEHADLTDLCTRLLHPDPKARLPRHEIFSILGGRTGERLYLHTAAAPDRCSAFTAREDVLAELSRAFEDARAGKAVSVYVRGESGVGKTALLHRFLDMLELEKNALVLRGRCYKRVSVPYKALDSIIDALIDRLANMPQADVRRLLSADVGALARLFPALGQLSAVRAASTHETSVLSDRHVRRRAVDALRELLGRLAGGKPVVLCIDDLQWGDVDSASLLTELFRSSHHAPLLLIACYQADDAGSSPCLRSLLYAGQADPERLDQRWLTLEPLSPREAHDLVLSLLTCHCSEAGRRAWSIAHESEGNPYFVVELVRYLRTHAPPCCETTDFRPIQLDEVLRQRIDRLSTPARELLNVIAIAGHPVRLEDAWRAAGSSFDPRLAVALAHAEHLIRTTGGGEEEELEAYHDRIREALIAQLTPEVRRGYHRRLAAALLESADPNPETLYFHFLAGGEQEKAGRYALIAADRAADALAFARAAKLYRAVLSCLAPESLRREAVEEKLANALAQTAHATAGCR